MHSKAVFQNTTPAGWTEDLRVRLRSEGLYVGTEPHTKPVSEVQTSLGLTLPPEQSELWAKEGLGTQIRLGCRVAGTSTRQKR